MDYLDNPKTMDIDHIIRALNLRHLNNDNDITFMLYLSLFTTLILCIGFAVLIFRSYKWKSLLAILPVFLYLMYKIIIGFNALDINLFKSFPKPEYSLIYLFYICDGIIIILSYCFKQSYEAMNLWLFFVMQPIIIIGLYIAVFRLQSKLKSSINTEDQDQVPQ